MIQMGTDLEAFVEGQVADHLEVFVEAELAQMDVYAARTLEVPEIPEAPTERLKNLWRELVFRGVSSSEDALQVKADWNPAAHPRGPDGQFVERPWDLPDDILGMDTEEIVRELARDDPDFAEKADGLQVDMDADLIEVARDAVQESPPEPDDGGSIREILDSNDLDSLDGMAQAVIDAAEEGVDMGEMAERISEDSSDRYVNRAMKEAAQEATADVDGFDAPARLAYTFESKGFPKEAEEHFAESVDQDELETIQESVDKWELDFFAENMAPFWQTAIEDTGNDNLLTDEESVSDADVGGSEMEAIRKQKEHAVEVMREIHGDSVTVYRAFQGDPGQKLEEAAESGEEIELERRALESYTTELSYTKGYVQGQRGAVIKREIPVERIWASSDAGFLAPEENEVVVGHDSTETIDPDNILTKEDLDDGGTNAELIGGQIGGMKNG